MPSFWQIVKNDWKRMLFMMCSGSFLSLWMILGTSAHAADKFRIAIAGLSGQFMTFPDNQERFTLTSIPSGRGGKLGCVVSASVRCSDGFERFTIQACGAAGGT